MVQEISVEALSALKNVVLIDVRSQKEFMEGTIPGALNIPLFDNDERAEIGTIYTHDSPKKAAECGLKIAGNKLHSLYKQVETLAGKNPVMLFCWRGGMRSKSFAMILDLMGLCVYRLNGGYKAYRRSLVDFFDSEFPYHVILLRGNTGTGKTEILQKLKKEGYPVIDLEGLSNNRGSVFGYIGLGAQPTQKQFESMLYQEIKNYQDSPYVLMECESKRIGRVTVPNTVYTAMQNGTQVLIYDTLDHRAQRLVAEYTAMADTDHELRIALERLKKRMGKESIRELLNLLDQNGYEDFAKKLIFEYYDLLYGYPNNENDQYAYCISNEDIEDATKELSGYLNKYFELGERTKD